MDAGSETLVDFHTHSHHSDGVLSPAALVERARTRGVSTLSLTDHDTFAGLEEARAACVAAAIDFVPGVELSASWRGQTIHIVGLQVNESHAGFNQAAELRKGLAEAPILATADDVLDLSGRPVGLGQVAIARRSQTRTVGSGA